MTSDTILSVQSLSVAFRQGEQSNLAVDNVSFDLKKGETFALVGESGSGKSVTAMAITKLLPESITEYSSGSVIFENENLLDKSESQLRQIRGNRIGMIFQEPLTALNPLHTVQKQIGEILRIHRGLNGKPATTRIIELLGLVGIPDPASRLGAYPHQLSGGQRQRVMIAMSIANNPDLLLADEPTTALDVTIQAQIIDLLKELNDKQGVSILFISHDLSLVKSFAQRTMVMYAGRIVESAPTDVLFSSPKHPYTKALIQLSRMNKNNKGEFPSIPGVVPPPLEYPAGCRFHPRCPSAIQECAEKEPDFVLKGEHSWACPIT